MQNRFQEQERLFKKLVDEKYKGSIIDAMIGENNSKVEPPLNICMFDEQPLPEQPLEGVDYTREKFWSKVKSRLSFLPAYIFYRGAKKKFKFDIRNREAFNNFQAMTEQLNQGREEDQQYAKGAVVTSNHFSVHDSLPIIDCQLHMKDRRRIYKVIQEANYGMSGVFGVFMRNNYTLPLSRSLKEMRRFLTACDQILKKGELILIYPEQQLWPDYSKPRPTRPGAFQIACRSNVPVIPCFTQVVNFKDDKGEDKQQYITHVLDPLYPNMELNRREREQDLQIRHFKALQAKYEEIYGIPLTYGEDAETETNEIKTV